MPPYAFEQFAPSSNGKMVNDHFFESVCKRCTSKYFKLKSNMKHYVENEKKTFFWEILSSVHKD